MCPDIGSNPVAEWLDDRFWQLVVLTEIRGQFKRIWIFKCFDICIVFASKVNFNQQRRSLLRLFLVSQDFFHEKRAILRQNTVVYKSDFVGVWSRLIVALRVIRLSLSVHACKLLVLIVCRPDKSLLRCIFTFIGLANILQRLLKVLFRRVYLRQVIFVRSFQHLFFGVRLLPYCDWLVLVRKLCSMFKLASFSFMSYLSIEFGNITIIDKHWVLE